MTKRKENPLSRKECARLAGLATAKSPKRKTPFVIGNDYSENQPNRHVLTREESSRGGRNSKRGTVKETREKLFKKMMCAPGAPRGH